MFFAFYQRLRKFVRSIQFPYGSPHHIPTNAYISAFVGFVFVRKYRQPLVSHLLLFMYATAVMLWLFSCPEVKSFGDCIAVAYSCFLNIWLYKFSVVPTTLCPISPDTATTSIEEYDTFNSILVEIIRLIEGKSRLSQSSIDVLMSMVEASRNNGEKN